MPDEDFPRVIRNASLLLLLAAVAALGQPRIAYRGIVNAASYLPPGLPNGGVARGSMFSVFGNGLGPVTAVQVSAFPIQPALGGVSIDITQGTTKVSALPVYVSAAQINAILPSNTPLGWVSVRLTFNGRQSNPSRLMVTDNSVGLFSANSGGYGPGIVYNFVSPTESPINSLVKTAMPGQPVVLWGTGLGAVSYSDGVAPTAESLPVPVEIFVGGVKATNVSYSGRAPCCSSLDQYVFNVPANAPSGCYVPVVVRTRGSTVSNTVTMAIDPAGAPCRDAHNPLTEQFRNGGKTALIHVMRETIHLDERVDQPSDVTSDSVFATFRDTVGSEFSFSGLTALPPLGTCTVYSTAANRLLSSSSPLSAAGAQVNVGSALTVESVGGNVSVPPVSGFDGSFGSLLSNTILNSGSISLSTPGNGPNAAFRLMLNQVNALNWTNRDTLSGINRARDLTLTWAGAPGTSRGVAIVGIGQKTSYNAGSAFLCLAPPNANSFTVPSYILSALPDSDVRESFASGQISIGNVPLAPGGPSVPGFAYSFTGVSNWTSKTVNWR